MGKPRVPGGESIATIGVAPPGEPGALAGDRHHRTEKEMIVKRRGIEPETPLILDNMVTKRWPLAGMVVRDRRRPPSISRWHGGRNDGVGESHVFENGEGE